MQTCKWTEACDQPQVAGYLQDPPTDSLVEIVSRVSQDDWFWVPQTAVRVSLALFHCSTHCAYGAAPIPHYGARGLNAGVLMASLAAVRASTFTVERDLIIDHYSPQGHLPLGDQDVLNIYGHYHPDQMYVMPCIFNFRCAFRDITPATAAAIGTM